MNNHHYVDQEKEPQQWHERSFIRAKFTQKNIIAGTTTRLGGFSSSPCQGLNFGLHVNDEKSVVDKNRLLLVKSLNLDAEPFWLNQIHGNKVVEAKMNSARQMAADGAYTYQSGLPLVVQSADCLPIIFAASNSHWIAIAHCGWRSLAANILSNVVNSFEGQPKNIVAWMGPCISMKNFQVAEDVKHAFKTLFRGNGKHQKYFIADGEGHWKADLLGLAKEQLLSLKVKQIHSAQEQQNFNCCTYENEHKFYSYRRSKVTGRMATIIYRRQ